MQSASAIKNSLFRITWRRHTLRCAWMLVACIGATFAAHGQSAALHTPKSAPKDALDDSLAIQIHDDRLTLSVAKAPQIYLYGVIDTDAPNRVAALIRTGKIHPGSDVYLDSPGGDLAAGLALGRLFRAGSMTTHLGAPRLTRGMPAVPRSAICVGACAYAYVGGLYRWGPTGNDRFGLRSFYATDPKTDDANKAQQSAGEVESYFKDMGLNPRVFVSALAASHDEIVWLSADQMYATWLTNNGQLPLTATNESSSSAPNLVITQTRRSGVNRITLLCRPDGLTMTAYYMVDGNRAKQIVARGIRPHFEIDQQEVLSQQNESATVLNENVVISRSYTFAQLQSLPNAHALGAWVVDRTNAMRYGFVLGIDGVKGHIRDYYASCQQTSQKSGEQRQ